MSSKALLWGACALAACFATGPRPALAEEAVVGPAPQAADPAAPARPAPPPDPAALSGPTTDPTRTVQLDEVVVRYRRIQVAGDPTGAATVIEASRFAGEAKDVAQLLATAPGVAVNEYGGLGQLATVSIRGVSADGILVLLDGLPLNTAFGGGVDLSSIPRAWIERIEVLRGPEGARYGAGALGGVVNVVTRRAAVPGWSAEASAGSFETFALAADGALVAGTQTTFVGASAESTGGRFPYLRDPGLPGGSLEAETRVNDASRRLGVLAKTDRVFPSGRLDGLLEVSAGHRGLPGFAEQPTPWSWQDDGRVVATARLARSDLWSDASISARAHLRLDWLDTLVSGPGDAPVQQRGGGSGLALQATVPHRGGLLGASLELDGELVTADGLGRRRGRQRSALALSDDSSLVDGRLRLAPAVRLESDGGFQGLSASLGLSLRLADWLAFRAAAGRTFRAPGLAELHLEQGLVAPNAALRPETSLAVDGALIADGAAGLLSVGGHLTRYRDLIVYQPSDARLRLRPYNSGQAVAAGLEAEAASAPIAGPLRATLAGSYTLLFTELLRGAPEEVGRWLPYRPRHRLYARLGIAPGPVAVHLEGQYVSRRFKDLRNVNPIPSSLAWNAGASVALWPAAAVRLHLEVRNLTDDRTLQDGFGNPLPSRMVMVTLRAGTPAPEGTP